MNHQIHFISQYLATAGKSFLKKKSDDSHTNVGFNAGTESLETWDLNEKGLKLVFDLPNFQLKWSTGDSFELDGKIHGQVLQWLMSSSKQIGLEKPYAFELHYDLPFKWSDDFSFTLKDRDKLIELIRLRVLANNVLRDFLKSENLKSDIRIWPHHFDTGAFVELDDGSGISIGLGMAIPDSMVNDHYFYISGYRGNDGIDTSNFKPLSRGEWKNDGFKGAILPTTMLTEDDAIKFLSESYAQYIG